MNFRIILVILISLNIIFLFTKCENPVEDEKKCDIESFSPISMPSYLDAIWHPSNKFIGFNYIPLDSITYPYGEHCAGKQYFSDKNRGFWIINVDGSNQRRIFPYSLDTPEWSPDGKWIVFSMGAQIYKMPFDIATETFDTTKVIKLTTKGRNFFPSWSPDGKWIAYNNTTCGSSDTPAPANSCGTLIMKSDGTMKKFIAKYCSMPTWSPDSKTLTYVKTAVMPNGTVTGDTLFNYNITTNLEEVLIILGNVNFDNRYPRYSPIENKLAFFSSGKGTSGLWLLESKSLSLQKITKDHVYGGGIFSWSPNGNRIVYTKHNFKDWSYTNGCLWVIDVNTKSEYQLTFNKKGG